VYSSCPIFSGAFQDIYNAGNGNVILQNIGYPDDGGVPTNNVATVNTNVLQVTSLAVSSTNGIAYQNYKNALDQAATYNILSGNTYPGIMASGDENVTVYATWFRLRTYPPSSVMPSVSYGPVAH
jgi:hypothetical protein